MQLEHRVRIKSIAESPYGKGIRLIELDGQEFAGVHHVGIDFDANDVHKVTLTFEAHVEVEEVAA